MEALKDLDAAIKSAYDRSILSHPLSKLDPRFTPLNGGLPKTFSR